MLRSDAFIPRLRANDPAVFELSFSGRRPTGPTLRILGDALKSNVSLKRLDLSNCGLCDDDVAPLLQLLEVNRGVCHLNLSGNAEVGCATATALRRCILGANNTLSCVVLDGTSVSLSDQEDLVFLISLNKFPTQLKQQAHRARKNEENFFTFELTHDTTDPKVYNEESARLVASSLAHNTIVRTLKMNRCCVGEHSLRELRFLFQVNTTLRRVALQENFLGSDSAVMIAAAIGKAGVHSSIQDIDLSINEIDDEGCEAFTQLLEENTSIRVVSLLRNRCSQLALDRLRTACALNCEPAELKPLLPLLQRDDGSVVSVELPGTADIAARGPGRGYFTSLGAATISEALLHNTHVHTITLPGNHIGADGAKALASLVARTDTLTSLNISGNPINDEGARHLILGLRQNNSLVELRMEKSNVSSKSLSEAAALCHLNAQPLPIKQILARGLDGAANNEEIAQLRQGILALSHRPYQPMGKWRSLHSESVPYVLTILKKLPSITQLDLSDNVTLGDAGVMQLVAPIRDPSCALRKLLICNTGITDASLSALTDAMHVNYCLQSIVVSPNSATTTKPQQRLDNVVQYNQFPPAVKDMIVPLQKNVAGVEEVRFVRQEHESPYGDDAVRILTSALQLNTHVKRFVFRGHRMSNRGMGYISELLLQNSTVTDIDVAQNDVGPDGTEDFANMLEQNVTLQRCDLSFNPLTEVGGTKLLHALQTANRSLQEICITQCRLLEPTKAKIEAQVGANTQPTFFRSVLEKLSGIPTVKFVGDASVGFLNARSVEALAQALRCIPSTHHIRSIEVPHNHLGDDGVRALVELVPLVPNLVSLDIFDNGITKAASIPLLQELCLRATKLTALRVFPAAESSNDPLVEELDDMLLMHEESIPVQTTLLKWRKMLANSTTQHKPTSSPTAIIEFADAALTSVSFGLMERLLRRYDALSTVRGISVLRCSLASDALSCGLVPLIGHCTLLGGLQLRDITPLTEGLATCLAQAVQSKPTLLHVELCDECAPASIISLIKTHVEQHMHAAAVSTVENMFAQAQQHTTEAKSRVPGGKRTAAGRPAVAVRSLEEEAAVFSDIMKDALRHMPARTPYQRGMYRSNE